MRQRARKEPRRNFPAVETFSEQRSPLDFGRPRMARKDVGQGELSDHGSQPCHRPQPFPRLLPSQQLEVPTLGFR